MKREVGKDVGSLRRSLQEERESKTPYKEKGGKRVSRREDGREHNLKREKNVQWMQERDGILDLRLNQFWKFVKWWKLPPFSVKIGRKIHIYIKIPIFKWFYSLFCEVWPLKNRFLQTMGFRPYVISLLVYFLNPLIRQWQIKRP